VLETGMAVPSGYDTRHLDWDEIYNKQISDIPYLSARATVFKRCAHSAIYYSVFDFFAASSVQCMAVATLTPKW
jgi:hypothetical protein